MLISFEAFVKRYLGKAIDYDGTAGVQCVDLIKLGLHDMYGISAGAWGNAEAYFNQFNNSSWGGYSVMQKHFDRIPNTRSFVPREGDICVFGKGFSQKHNCGHIGWAAKGCTVNKIKMYDFNATGKHDPMKISTYGYSSKDFLGVLRPKRGVPDSQASLGVYEVVKSVNVRKGAGTIYSRIPFSCFSANAQEQVKKLDNSCPDHFPSGVRVSVNQIKGTWGKCPSGWISLKYCRKVD